MHCNTSVLYVSKVVTSPKLSGGYFTEGERSKCRKRSAMDHDMMGSRDLLNVFFFCVFVMHFVGSCHIIYCFMKQFIVL